MFPHGIERSLSVPVRDKPLALSSMGTCIWKSWVSDWKKAFPMLLASPLADLCILMTNFEAGASVSTYSEKVIGKAKLHNLAAGYICDFPRPTVRSMLEGCRSV